ARTRLFLRCDARTADALAALAALCTHGFERAYTALVARAPRLDALPDPDLLLREALVECRRGIGFVGQRLVLVGQITVVIARIGHQPAAVQIDNACCQRAQQGTVVGDEQQRSRPVAHNGLELRAGSDNQLVG